MTRPFCKTCAVKWGRELWEGACVCTGDVELSPKRDIKESPFRIKRQMVDEAKPSKKKKGK